MKNKPTADRNPKPLSNPADVLGCHTLVQSGDMSKEKNQQAKLSPRPELDKGAMPMMTKNQKDLPSRIEGLPKLKVFTFPDPLASVGDSLRLGGTDFILLDVEHLADGQVRHLVMVLF